MPDVKQAAALSGADSPSMPRVTSAQRWTVCAAIALVALVFLLFWPSTASLMVRWQDTVHRTYTHGYLIVALSLWLIWRDAGLVTAGRAWKPGIVVLLGLGLLWLIAWRAGLQIVHQALLPMLAFFAVVTCCGWAVMRQMFLPVAYLYFAVPVWDALNTLLQEVSVVAVRALLRLAGIPAFFADNTFQLPAGAFEIADGCSGLHFFVVAAAISVFYGAVNRDTLRIRVKLVAFALLLAMATNWLRIFIIVVAGHLTDMQHYLVSGEHYSFGWVMFALAMLLFFLVVRRWPLEPASVPAVTQDDASSRAPFVGLMLSVAGLAAAPLVNALDDNLAPSAQAHDLPAQLPEWTGANPVRGAASWQPLYPGSDVEQRREYGAGGHSVEAYAAIYLFQTQGKEIVGFGNSVLGETLHPLRRARRVGDSAWNEMQARDGKGDEWLLRFSYRIDDRWYSSSLRAQLSYAVRSLSGEPLSSIIVIRSRCTADCTNAESALARVQNALAH